MGIFNLILCLLSTCICYYKRLDNLFILSISTTFLNICSFIMMIKFRNNLKALPKSWVLINMLSTLMGIVILMIIYVLK